MDFLKKINFENSWSRFPLSTAAAVCVGILLVYLNETTSLNNEAVFTVVQKCIYALMMLFFTSLFVSFWSFKNGDRSIWRYLIPITFSSGYYFCLPYLLTELSFLKHAALIIIFLLLLVPWVYPRKDEEKSFWSFFVYHLVLIVETTAFSVFVFGSISIAIYALEKLFGISFKGFEIYLNLFIVIASIFHPIYFLSRAKLPAEEFPTYNQNKVLQIFASKILLPIVFLYAIILSAYFLKILFQGAWPKGWVSNLILWFSAFAVPAYFLNNYLYAEQEKPSYIRLFEKGVFYFLVLCSVVLAMAVQVRVSDYGLTESRYLLIILAIWLFLISFYFIFSKKKALTVLPISLACFMMFTFFGPMNIFDASVQSQYNRFKNNISSLDLDNKAQTAQIADQLRFLDNHGRLDLALSMSDFSHINFDPRKEESTKAETLLFYGFNRVHPNNPKAVNEICETLGFDYNKAYQNRTLNNHGHFNFYSNEHKSMDISAYDHFIILNSHQGDNQAHDVRISKRGDKIIIDYNESFSLPVNQVFNSNYDNTIQNHPPHVFDYQTNQAEYHFVFSAYSGNIENDRMQMQSFQGYLFVKSLDTD